MADGMNYLESGRETPAAIRGIGSQFNDMLVGLYQNRMRQQQFMAEQAMEAARVRMEQQRTGSELQTAEMQRQNLQALMGQRAAEATSKLKSEKTIRKGTKAETRRTEALTGKVQQETGDIAAQRKAGGEYGDLMQALAQTDPAKDPQTYAYLRSLMLGRAGQLAAYYPSTIGQQTAQLLAERDPMLARLIATRTPLTEHVAPGTSLLDVTQPQQPLYTAPFRQPMRTPLQEMESAARSIGPMVRGTELDPTGELGMAARSAGTNIVGRVQGILRGGSGTLKVRHPVTGQVGTIPVADQNDAIKEGYEILGPGE